MLRPLAGLKVIEFEGIGPGPLAGRMLADQGAEVIVDRPSEQGDARQSRSRGERRSPAPRQDGRSRSTSSGPEAVEEAMRLIEDADALIEGNRPGVMERLGLGPADCAKRNPRLVYGRMTGWGQDGPLAQAAGHDLNYLALTGALSLDGAHRVAPRSRRRPCSATRAARSGSPSGS